MHESTLNDRHVHIKYRGNRRLTPIFHPTSNHRPHVTLITTSTSSIFLLTFKTIGLPVIRTDDLMFRVQTNALSLRYIGPMKNVIMNFHMVLHSQGSLPDRHARTKFQFWMGGGEGEQQRQSNISCWSNIKSWTSLRKYFCCQRNKGKRPFW